MKELLPTDLGRTCDLSGLAFDTTDDLEDLEGLLGQPRALDALEFGIGMERDGYNVFAFGPDGTGKHSAVRQMLERHAADRPAPADLCYVHNFADPQKPRLLELPAGKGQELCRAMAHLVADLTTALQSALESDEYQARRQRLEDRTEELQSKNLAKLSLDATEAGLALIQTPVGIVFGVRRDDEVLSAEQVLELPEKERERLDSEIDRLKDELATTLRLFARWKREKRAAIRELNREVSRFAVGPLLEEIRDYFAKQQGVSDYLTEVENDIIENAERLSSQQESTPQEALGVALGQEPPETPHRHYKVNLLVDNSGAVGAPVVYEDNPTYQNLVGRIDHISRMGTLATDFTLVQAGNLHRASGGYLLLDAIRLLRHPYAWDGLKRALRSRKIKIEALGEALSLLSTHSLLPEPAELSAKIVLLGDRRTYYLLSQLDPDFSELFKVAADFSEELDWSDENCHLYTRLIAKLTREEKLKPFDRSAVARLIERGAREISDSRKMSLYMGRVLDLMREANFFTEAAKRDTVTAVDVQRAVDARIFRSDRVREQLHERIHRGTLLVDTDGARVGQVNGLSVLQLHDFRFGQPSRITARVRLGKGEVIHIEREVELSGPIHSKGVLILAGYLGAKFASERPLALAASLVFEQSYGGVEGDSASAAELFALLSAIAQIPIRQSLAVTGSINQNGQIQAIGGVNEKVEGFFDVCATRGLDGTHGVLIPESNVEHLMLRQNVIDAVRDGLFHIYPLATVDQGIELLTGIASGEPDGDGKYPEGTVNALVEARLATLATRVQEFTSPREKPATEPG